MSTDKRQGIAGIIFLLMVFSTPTIFHSASAQISTGTNNIGVYAGNSIPYGLNYSAWEANWWKWLMQIESKANPASDSTGSNCIKNQSGPVWFLAGSTSGIASRTCTVPAGKAILFPVVGAECSYAENPNLKTESELRNCAVTILNVVSHIEAKVDTTSLQNSQMPRIQSPLFSFTFPGNNIFGAPGGPSQSVGDGFFVFLKPLSIGKHDIAFKATGVQYTTTGVNNLSQDIVYHLTVQ
ncbi:MAG: hypothetical protein M3P08_19075 [Thermoproteota archaeon]|nr:hypothetical protein [Thermoproteota archaeon]